MDRQTVIEATKNQTSDKFGDERIGQTGFDGANTADHNRSELTPFFWYTIVAEEK